MLLVYCEQSYKTVLFFIFQRSIRRIREHYTTIDVHLPPSLEDAGEGALLIALHLFRFG